MDVPFKLEIDSAQCRFGYNNVLNSAYLSCQVGEVVGVLGKNGAGKSVLLKMIFGTLNGQFKRITIDGKIIRRGFKSGKIAYLPQSRLFPSNSEVEFLVNIFTDNYREMLLENIYIKNHLNYKLHALSSGQARFIETLILLYSDSPFVLLDEPFTYLEPLLRLALLEEIEKIKMVKGVIVTDHSYRDIFRVSDRIVLIHNGGNYHVNEEEDLITHGYIPDFL
ncbi:MAG: ATP-binding cassette domain-containing protein [Sphingobacterium sp.]